MRPGHISGRGPADVRRSCLGAQVAEGYRRVGALIGCRSGVEHGKVTTMSVATIDPAEVLAPFGDAEVIPLPDVANLAGMNRGARTYAVEKGIIRTATGPGAAGYGRQGSYVVTRDEALLILVSAALAATIGVAVVTMIKTLRNNGATITADAVTIPLSGLKTAGKAV